MNYFVIRPLSRLTYCAYLIHPLIILYQYRNMEACLNIYRHTFYFFNARSQVAVHGSISTMAWLYVGNLGLSYAAALLLALVFEAPFLNIQKMLKL